MGDNKRKRKAISLEMKHEIVTEVEKGLISKAAIGRKYGLASSTLSTILKNKDSIKANFERGSFQCSRKRFRSGDYKDIEDALFEWCSSARSEGGHITGPELASQAEAVAQKLGRSDFKASNGFIERFKERRGLRNLNRKQKKPVRSWKENIMEYSVLSEDYNVAEYYDNFGHTLPKIVMVNQGFCGEIIQDTFDRGQDCNVAEYYDNFGHTLQKIVMVNQGFCGDIIQDTFDRGQIMRLHTVSRQKRVIAKFVVSRQKRLVSIPISYQDKMCVLDKKGNPGREKTLAAIVKDHQLPVSIQFPRDHTLQLGNQSISSNWIPNMELVQTFDEMYFLANFIADGIVVSEVTPVPLYLKQLRVVDVTGIIGQPTEKWQTYVRQIEQTCSKFHYDTGFGNSEVAVYDPSANYQDTTYSFIEPTVYSPMHSFFKKPVFGNPSYTIKEEPFDDIEPVQAGDVYEEIGSGAPRNVMTKGNRQLTQELNKVIKTNQTGMQNKSPIAVSPPMPPPKPTLSSTHSFKGTPELPDRKPVINSSRTVKPEPTEMNFRAYSNVATKVIPAVNEQNESFHHATRTENPVSQSMQTKNPVFQSRMTENLVSQSIPTAFPVLQSKPSTNQLQSLESQDEVKSLTMDQLSEYLKALNLGLYVDKFKSEMIDGSLLIELDKDVLKQEFGLKTVEAIRLEKFAKTGHIPS